jgi:hypothetical protein
MDEHKLHEYLLYADALLKSMKESVGRDPSGPWKFISFRTYMRKYNDLVTMVSKEIQVDTILSYFDTDKIGYEFNTAGVQQQTFFEAVFANLSILKAFLESKLNVVQDEIRNLKDFFQSNLRKAIFDVPTHEIEIQNAIEQLLIGRGLSKGIDYDRETGRVKTSIKESIPDFIFPRLGLALEAKLSKDATKAKALARISHTPI